MNDELRLLCMSFRIPPAVRPAASMINKMAKEWIRREVNAVIVGYESVGSEKWDISLPVYTIPTFHVHQNITRVPGLAGLFERKYYRDMAVTIERIIKKHSLNVIFSFSNPIASNIIGAILKDRLDLPFVAHMTDPWYDNPYLKVPARTRNRILREERNFIEKCDAIVFVNEQMKELIMKKYPSEWIQKAHVIPHCFDPRDYPSEHLLKNQDAYVFAHIGFFYPQRNPKKFFEVLKIALDKRPDLRHKVVFRSVGGGGYSGYTNEQIVADAEKCGLLDILDIIPTVTHEESLKHMMSVNCLVAIDADMSPSPFLMSKIVDYGASGTPIIGLTPEGSTTQDFLKNIGYRSFNYHEDMIMADYLIGLVDGRERPAAKPGFMDQFDVKNTTEKFFKLFNNVRTLYGTSY